MNISEDLLAKVRKDFADYCQSKDINKVFDFNVFLAGYLASLKRFGGNGFLPKNPKSAYYNNGD